MREKVDYFTADYRDGRVHIGGKVYQAGYFATHLLNQFYENDTAARISVFTTDNWHLEQTLEIGYMDKKDFLETGERMLNIFKALPWLGPLICSTPKRNGNVWQISLPKKSIQR